jgi:hypothetical protein
MLENPFRLFLEAFQRKLGNLLPFLNRPNLQIFVPVLGKPEQKLFGLSQEITSLPGNAHPGGLAPRASKCDPDKFLSLYQTII